MQVARQLAGRDPQLLLQPPTQPVVYRQRLPDVALSGQRLHQQSVPALTERRILDECSARAQRGAQFDSAETDACSGDAFVRAKPKLAQITPEPFDPFRLLADEESAAGDMQGDSRRTPRLGPRLSIYRGFSSMDRGPRRFEVDERVFREDELHHVAVAFDREGSTEPRQQRREAAVTAVRPQDTDELVARRGTSAMENEIGEKAASLAPRQRRLDPRAAEIRDQAAAQLDPHLRQPCANLAPTVRRYKIPSTIEGGAMAKVINCECGQVIRGETDEEVVGRAEEHVNRDHPELVGKITRDDLLAMAETV